MYKVHTPFINPFVFNRLRGKEPYLEAHVMDSETVECCGDYYTLSDASQTLPVGEQVWLCIYGGFFHVETKDEHEQRVLKRLASQWSKRQESER